VDEVNAPSDDCNDDSPGKKRRLDGGKTEDTPPKVNHQSDDAGIERRDSNRSVSRQEKAKSTISAKEYTEMTQMLAIYLKKRVWNRLDRLSMSGRDDH
jgi:hypothetical protein